MRNYLYVLAAAVVFCGCASGKSTTVATEPKAPAAPMAAERMKQPAPTQATDAQSAYDKQ